MKKIRLILAAFGLVSLSALTTVPAIAAPTQACIGAQQAQGKDLATAQAACADNDTAKTELQSGLTGLIKTIIDILLFLIGAVAVIMIIIGGIRYTTSNGDQAQVTAAKNTILYAVVGLVVAIMAYAIVNWVIASL